MANSPEFVDLFYKEVTGNPIHPSGYTQEYRVLKGVTRSEAQLFIDKFNHIRASWRTAPTTTEASRG